MCAQPGARVGGRAAPDLVLVITPASSGDEPLTEAQMQTSRRSARAASMRAARGALTEEQRRLQREKNAERMRLARGDQTEKQRQEEGERRNTARQSRTPQQKGIESAARARQRHLERCGATSDISPNSVRFWILV